MQDGVCVPDCSVPTGSTYNAMVEEGGECK